MKIIRIRELAELLGVSKVTVYRMENDGELPPRRRISKRLVGYLQSEIEEWLTNRPQVKTKTTKNLEGGYER